MTAEEEREGEQEVVVTAQLVELGGLAELEVVAEAQ